MTISLHSGMFTPVTACHSAHRHSGPQRCHAPCAHHTVLTFCHGIARAETPTPSLPACFLPPWHYRGDNLSGILYFGMRATRHISLIISRFARCLLYRPPALLVGTRTRDDTCAGTRTTACPHAPSRFISMECLRTLRAHRTFLPCLLMFVLLARTAAAGRTALCRTYHITLFCRAWRAPPTAFYAASPDRLRKRRERQWSIQLPTCIFH